MNRFKQVIRGDRFFNATVVTLMVLFLIIEVYPLIYVVSCSFSDPDAVVSGKVFLFPEGFTLGGYKQILKFGELWIGYGNTFFYTIFGTLFDLALTLPCAYALSRRELAGRKYFMVFFMITMYIGGGLIPGYLNVKSLHLIDTRSIMVILGGVSVYNLIVARTFFANSIPYELTEAARIDGCDNFKTFARIIMPLSRPIVVVLALYYGIGHWNSFFTAMIYLDDRTKYPLQMFLREILLLSKLADEAVGTGALDAAEMAYLKQQAKEAELIKFGVIIVATVPMLTIYPFLQKYFEKGIMIGSVKG